MLNLGRLRVLSEVVARGSFSAAAEALSYTQSAVSQSIARLEAETGATLVIRDRRGVRPTAAGATLVEHAEAIFAQVELPKTIWKRCSAFAAGGCGWRRSRPPGATLMPLAVATFRARHPDVALTLAEGEPEEIAPRLRAGEFDLALLFEFPGVRERPASGLRSVTLLEDPMDVALPADHPLAAKPALTLADLRERGMGADVGVSPCARHVVRSCLAAGFEPERDVRERRLRDGPGAGRGRRRRGADPAAGVDPGAPGIVVRALAPRSPARKVTCATLAGPGTRRRRRRCSAS